MALTTEILGLLVRTAPVDDANNPFLEVLMMQTTDIIGPLVRTAPGYYDNDHVDGVLHMGRCSIQNLFSFLFNPFLIKSPLFFKKMLEIGILNPIPSII